jgi:hypothetical protein
LRKIFGSIHEQAGISPPVLRKASLLAHHR